MSMIIYKKTTFNEPAFINADTYNYLKHILTVDPTHQINTNKETFTAKYKRSFRFLIFALPILAFLIGYNVYFKDTPQLPLLAFRILAGINILLGCICCFVIINMLLEGTSYAVYLHNKQHYFLGMEHAIKQSNSFEEFKQLFYGASTKTALNYKLRAAEALDIYKPPLTLDRFLIGLFRIFDVLSYILGFAAIGWAIWHYFIKK